MKLLSSLVFILLCSVGYAQVVYDTVPINKQLIGRDLVTNQGDIIINGNVENTLTPYDSLKVKLYRNNLLQDSISKPLVYSGINAPFDFEIPILAELANYKVEIYGKTGIVETIEHTVDSLVAGDAFIINGQSNAQAKQYGGSANGNQSPFIRVYAQASDANSLVDLINNDNWYIAQGDGDNDSNGNTGQWGLTLAKTLLDSIQVPVAIFNGAAPGLPIRYFAKDFNSSNPNYYNVYQKLDYRLNKTGLGDKVRAVFWAQGESNATATPWASASLTVAEYKNKFTTLKNNWLSDYINIEHIYIFQTRNGACYDGLYLIKEAQRQMAFENGNISIMSTQGIGQMGDACHFPYIDGYKTFANRISPLVLRDLYGETFPQEIETPLITDAFMQNDTTLVVDTDAVALSIDGNAVDFRLEDSALNDLTSTIDSIKTQGNKILFHLSANPGNGATISYLGQDGNPYPNDTSSGFIINTSGIEIISFYRYPIVPPSNATPSLLITQYYEGANNDQWVEVKNISSNPINGGDYYLALFDETKAIDGTIQISNPDQSVQIVGSAGLNNPILPGEVILFKNPSAALPPPLNLGSAHTISDQVCNFDGDDVILISSTNDNTSFDNMVDIVGVVASSGSPPNWGQNKSFAKGYTNSMESSTVFTATNYTELALSEVDNALSDMNIALGTQNTGATTWTFGSIWDNGTSDRTRSAIIAGSYDQTYGSLSAGKLLIQSIVDFNNTSTNYIEVSDSLIVDNGNGGLLTLGDKASLYTVNEFSPDSLVSIIGVIGKTETTTQLTNNGDYTYWSSPLENENTINVFPPSNYNQGRIYYWDQSVANSNGTGGSEVLGEWINASNSVMTPGKGYISQGPTTGVSYPSTTDITFSGKPNTGKIQLIGSNDLVFNDNPNLLDDLNLVGNPYPSAIDAHELLDYSTNKLSVGGTIWFWTHYTPNNGSSSGEQYTSDDYASYNLAGGIGTGSPSPSNPTGAVPTRYIGSGQGFMVRAISSVSDTLTFTDAMREKDLNTQFFRGSDNKKESATEKDRVWLNFESSEGGAFSQILIGFFENATDNFDRLYDGIKISEGWINLYSKIDTLKYGIQGLSSFTTDKQVPLAFNSYIDNTSIDYTISIDRFEGVLKDNDIYLVDNELNVTHDLKQEPYNFTLPSWGSYDDRFTLQFAKSTLGVDDLELNNDFIVVNEDNALLVKSKTIISELKIYDITGRLLVNMLPNDSEFRINTHNIRKGTVLILNTTFENGTEISKKAIKY
ncbi:sialate O-acetylesterase [Aureibaculum conchae]|uniref:sialate O-acetylesterase n=1 Tax=Aureibaculum sp. 2308TA14-22 TaxID=3108392 RepID=UPI0033931B51